MSAAGLAPPLRGVKVLEFGSLAISSTCGLLCADYGADVVRVDRAQDRGKLGPDVLNRNKRSICIDLKDPADITRFKALVRQADVLIESFRAGTMEKLGLGPEVLMKENERLVYARVTGFRRDSPDKDKPGHSINFVAPSGVLNLLGRQSASLPAMLLAGIAGGGASCFQGILLALFVRERTGRGQVVDASIFDGGAYLTTMPRLLDKYTGWERFTDTFDLDCPYYNTYETADGKLMAVGALEPQFYKELLKALGLPVNDDIERHRYSKETWEKSRNAIKQKFGTKTREEWERVFEGVDACVTPVYSDEEVEGRGCERRVPVELSLTPGLKIEKEGEGKLLLAGQHQDEVFDEWLGGNNDLGRSSGSGRPLHYPSVAAKSRI
ncbi:hypothetical protein TWF481_005856 [Arthrobotrys musiformis]|uniref:Uncharacterized protein n=1 Tax=Arthrobotrys musiformis TaxID=47236 RepID=A0AAV9WF02_9PEZI